MSLGVRSLGLLIAGLLAFPTQLAFAAPPQELRSYTAEYNVSRGKFVIGLARISLRIDKNGQYQYQGYTKPTGIVAVFRKDEITETSEGVIKETQITPQSYHYTHKKSDKTRQVDLNFDWKKSRVTNQTAGSQWHMLIPPDTQDKLSIQLALMLSLSQDNNYSSFQVADGGRLKNYHFRAQGQVPVKTKAGQFDTIKVVRRKGKRPSRTTLWMAPELNYVPVRIMKIEKDGEFVMELNKIHWPIER